MIILKKIKEKSSKMDDIQPMQAIEEILVHQVLEDDIIVYEPANEVEHYK